MKMPRTIIISVFTLLSAIITTGCLSISADELYRLPEAANEYLRLQAQINILLSQGAVYASPSRGPNRQAVQLKDINGNGNQEIIAFFSSPGDSKLMVHIFTLDGDDYKSAAVIESAGTDIESVRYIDMDGDGVSELIIGWQMGTALKYMSIYSMVDFHSQLIVSGDDYSEITSYNADGSAGDDVVILKFPTLEAGNATAKIYSLMKDGEIVTQEARLSAGAEIVTRIINGKLADGIPALFIESEGRFENGTLVTDVLTRQDGEFVNISLHPIPGVSADTVRQRMNSSDINGDGIIKIPELRRLMAQSDTEYYAIDWYSYLSSGMRKRELTTYHNTFDEWYLILPDDWREKISVRREDNIPGERTITFSYFEENNGAGYRDILKIYRLSGENALAAAQQDGRVLLPSEASAVFAFEILVPQNSFGLTLSEDMVRDNFRMIRTEWQPR